MSMVDYCIPDLVSRAECEVLTKIAVEQEREACADIADTFSCTADGEISIGERIRTRGET